MNDVTTAEEPADAQSSTSDTPQSETAEKILVEASELFARHGYAGTSTRMIAAAVDIRQPSLFHHFDSKAAIISELLRASVEKPAALAVQLAKDPRPAAERLVEYLRFDIHHILASPYNLVGLQRVLSSPYSVAGIEADERAKAATARWRKVHEQLRRARRRLIADGMAEGDFIELDVDLADDAITGLVLGTILGHSRHNAEPWRAADELAQFALRALRRTPE
jgi:AcrR family transcriptional regulator